MPVGFLCQKPQHLGRLPEPPSRSVIRSMGGSRANDNDRKRVAEQITGVDRIGDAQIPDHSRRSRRGISRSRLGSTSSRRPARRRLVLAGGPLQRLPAKSRRWTSAR